NPAVCIENGSHVDHNDANSDGGGVYNSGNVTVDGSSVDHNNSENGEGGGLYNNQGNVLFQDSSADGNTAYSSGGALYNGFSGIITVANSTVDNNGTYLDGGGGIFNDSNGGESPYGLILTDYEVNGNVAGDSGRAGGGGLPN